MADPRKISSQDSEFASRVIDLISESSDHLTSLYVRRKVADIITEARELEFNIWTEWAMDLRTMCHDCACNLCRAIDAIHRMRIDE